MRKEIGPIASPDLIQFAPGLPKTRSGKIMRRIFRKIAEDDFSNLGNISTLADPAVIDDLIQNRQNKEGATAALIAGFMVLGAATWFVGFVVVFPLIGHATWHAFRGLVADTGA